MNTIFSSLINQIKSGAKDPGAILNELQNGGQSRQMLEQEYAKIYPMMNPTDRKDRIQNYLATTGLNDFKTALQNLGTWTTPQGATMTYNNGLVRLSPQVNQSVTTGQDTTSQTTYQSPNQFASAASYTGSSIVDFLKQAGKASDYNSRAALAREYGIPNYSGTASQNTQLLNSLRQIAQTPTTVAGTGTPSTGAYTGGGTGNVALDSLLSNPNIDNGQRQAAQGLYTAMTSNDKNITEAFDTAMKAALQWSSPYFKAQIRLVLDSLQRGMASQEGDLEFKETQLNNLLKDTQADIASAKDYLSFQETQELQELAKTKKQELDATAEQMAALGKTSSSVRSKKEQLINESNQGLVESTNRAFTQRQNELVNKGSRSVRDTSLEVERLKELASQGKLDILRQTEAKVGSDNLSNLGYTGLLGDIGGEIPRSEIMSAKDWAYKNVNSGLNNYF